MDGRLNVLVVYNNPRQASFRLRTQALVPPLAARGIVWETAQLPRTGRRAFFADTGRYDVVVVLRKFLDPGVARVLRRHARRVVLDIDDALMHENRPVGLVGRWRNRRRYRATRRVLDAVAAGNAHLLDVFAAHGVPGAVVPTVLDAADYTPRTHADDATLRLVWVGSRSTLPYLLGGRGGLVRAARTLREGGRRTELTTVADAAPPAELFPGIRLRHVEWDESAEKLELARADVGIAPTPDDPFTRGKCGFKILQYMAAGLPCVASPVGANRQIVVDGVTGRHATSEAAWARALTSYADTRIRAQAGRAARARVRTLYSPAAAADAWADLLARVTGGPSAQA